MTNRVEILFGEILWGVIQIFLTYDPYGFWNANLFFSITGFIALFNLVLLFFLLTSLISLLPVTSVRKAFHDSLDLVTSS